MKAPRAGERTAIDFAEEAIHVLRLTPAPVLAAYYLGGLPFILGLLFFWSDMARSAFAAERLIPGALAMTCLFIWMKTWQSVFLAQLLARMCGEPSPRWTIRWLLRSALLQTIIQPSGLFLLPIALVLMVPFGWGYAFYANVATLGAGSSPDTWTLVKRCWRQATLWPVQNHYLICLFALFGLFVFFSFYSALLAVPLMIDRFLGIETVFSMNPFALMNSTVTAAVAGMSYLAVDPVVKTAYALRCFYGESLRTGQDLKADLRRFAGSARQVTAALVLLLTLTIATATHAAEDAASVAPGPQGGRNTSRSAPKTIVPSQLNESIERTIQQREYAWRLPRQSKLAPNGDPLSNASLGERIRRALDRIGLSIQNGLRSLTRWLRKVLTAPGGSTSSGSSIAAVAKGLLFFLLVALCVFLGWLVIRLWRANSTPEEFVAQRIDPVPDLANEDVGADELPENEWIQLGRDLLERGELRLALRAFYLATLANLAGRNLLVLARFKSNQDYLRELQRRGHALAQLLNLFSLNLTVFERVWYGRHEPTPDMLHDFAGNVERIKAG